MSNSANLMSSFNFSSNGGNLAERSMSVCLSAYSGSLSIVLFCLVNECLFQCLFRVIKYCLCTGRSVKTVRYYGVMGCPLLRGCKVNGGTVGIL